MNSFSFWCNNLLHAIVTLIGDFFNDFLKLEPKAKILENHVTKGDNWCQDVGK